MPGCLTGPTIIDQSARWRSGSAAVTNGRAGRAVQASGSAPKK